jgi:hypothetical protein
MEHLILGMLVILVLVLLYINYSDSKKMSKISNKLSSTSSKKSFGAASDSELMQFPADSSPVNNSYNDYILSSGLDQSVVDSHKNFVNQIQKSTTGASTLTELSGDVYATQFVGLRRPDLQSIYIDPNSRVVPSEDQAIMPKGNKLYKCGLF